MDRLPSGSRDLLPEAARRRRLIVDALAQTFAAWGYREVVTPAIEYFEVLGRGLDDTTRERSVRFIESGTGEVVTLRTDVTPQIARLVAQRMDEAGLARRGIVRLAYAADVVRLPSGTPERGRTRAELHQVGVEAIGGAEPDTDPEIIVLAHEALRRVGLRRFRLDLAHVAIATQVLDALGLHADVRRVIRGPLGRKDPAGIVERLTKAGVAAKAQAVILALCELHGPPDDVIPAARRHLAGCGVDALLDRLASIVETVAAIDAEAYAKIVVDVGETRGFDYYTGLRLSAWAQGVAEPVVRGGRYDQLVERYGLSAPATGFAVDLDALEDALRWCDAGPTAAAPPPTVVVAVAPGLNATAYLAAAHAEAARVRRDGAIATIEHELHLDDALALARARGATSLLWISHGRAAASGAGRRKAVHASAPPAVERFELHPEQQHSADGTTSSSPASAKARSTRSGKRTKS